MLKEFLKGWNREVFEGMEAQFNKAAKKVEHVDMKNEEGELEDFELEERHEGFQEMWAAMRKKEAIWKQKSRSNWVQLGDANTRFFHRVANGTRAQNSISGEDWKRPRTAGIKFKQISQERKEWLERPFSEEEIEEGLRSCEGTKALGPDGYNFNFLKCVWHSIKEDFVSFFKEFHQNGRLVGGLNSSFLTLIPKKLSPTELKDYRPISLIGCVYKLLAKVISHKLKTVMPKIISDTQSAFLGGRQLVDSILVLNEVVDEVKKMKRQAFVFKANFEKAYDCVDWEFLDWMMGSFGFGTKWRGWIKECLSTARVSILVKGSPTEEFKMGKGLRQGDPLSPFLFLMIGERLHDLVNKAETEDMFHRIPIGTRGLDVSLLQFADDTVIMGRANSSNIFMVKCILRWFELMSGVKINFSKSSVCGFNVLERWLKGVARVLQCGVGKTPFICLGMPVGGKLGSKKFWRKIPWVNWELVCCSRMKGGLGVPDLCRRNWALLGKWWARLGDGLESLWKQVVREKYYGGRRKVDITGVESGRVSKIWNDVVKIGGMSAGLRNLLLKKGKEDHWWWIHGLDGQYVVKTAYEALAPIKCTLVDQFCKMI
ncbi:hypothetical protein SLEP1_g23370 [Rubroshorea leprosula]|uniref:Reverse transcriptase domain-containing protein n=1 Tax=Rubroshorea leprosula TaxID=152421 RepID=A0AAV5JC62_9ROSI|nr:hypothetical protein SLEP1_g23370 [Rubroshorea leprosula]